MPETSTKPYMIRALYEWCCDNGYTPYLAVAVDDRTLVPRQHVKGGEIVLNVSPMATSRLTLGNELVEFQARFSGVAQQISIPVPNISAIYARETGHGMAFEVLRGAGKGRDREELDGDDGGDGGQGLEAGEGRKAFEGDGAGDDDASRRARLADSGAGERSPGSSVQSLRGGAQRRGPRSVDLGRRPEGGAAPGRGRGAGRGGDDVGDDRGAGGADSRGTGGYGDPAANSRKRAGKGQGSAEVIEFAPSGGRSGKKGGKSRGRSDEAGESSPASGGSPDDDKEDPPPSGGGDASGGDKGRKTRLTRVK